MSSSADAGGPQHPNKGVDSLALRQSMECQLFESLAHHLMEKGILTKNDVLSVVQTVAEVKRGELEEDRSSALVTQREIHTLARLYSSFDMKFDWVPRPDPQGSGNIMQLRPPLHSDETKFPCDD